MLDYFVSTQIINMLLVIGASATSANIRNPNLKWRSIENIDFDSLVAACEQSQKTWFELSQRVTNETDLRGASNKSPDFFRMGTFIDITLMKL